MKLSAVLRISAATAVAVATGASAIGTTLAQLALDAADHETAASANPLSSEAKAGLAADFLSQDQHVRAAALALSSIRRSPLNADAAAILGYIEDQRGNVTGARELMALAASLSWANETAQLWMLGQAATANRFDETVARADALLRQRLGREELFEYLRALTAQPAALKPLARHLALRPRWRQDFVGALAGLTPEGFGPHGLLLAELKKTAAPPTPEEINAYVARLVADARYEEAKAAWGQFADTASQDALINDGEFRHLRSPSDRSPFEWTVTAKPGLEVRTDASPAGGGPSALRISSDGRPSEPAIEQVIVLGPGRYALTASQYAGRPDSLDSVRWDVTCLGGDAQPAVSSRSTLPQQSGWVAEQTSVTVPATGCPAQRLALRIDHDKSSDLDLWLRRVQIRRIQ